MALPYCTQQHFRWFKLSPVICSTTWKAGAKAVIKRRKDEAATAKSSAQGSLEWPRPGANGRWDRKPTQTRSHSQDSLAARPCHKDVSSSHSCKLHACSTIAANPSQETANELIQPAFSSTKKNPGMIDAGICGGKISHWEPKPPAHLQRLYGVPSAPGADSFFAAMSSSNSSLSISQRMSSGAFWTYLKIASWRWRLSPSMRAWRIVLQCSHSLLHDSSSFSRGWKSSSVTAWRQSIGFLERQARRPSLHFAKALSLSVCVQGKLQFSASLCESFRREACTDLAQAVKVDALEGVLITTLHINASAYPGARFCRLVTHWKQSQA